MKCRNCSCTDDKACVLNELNELVDIQDGTIAYDLAAAGLHVCYWVDVGLCSGCVVNPGITVHLVRFDARTEVERLR